MAISSVSEDERLGCYKKQKEVIKNMLLLHEQSFNTTERSQDVWKVLIYDMVGQDIISPLMAISELRDCGVTLNLNINSKREPISDTPVIYFVEPTKKNIEKICSDMINHLYSSFYLFFITPIPRVLLEEIANSSIKSGTTNLITKIYDEYLGFITLSDDLFVTRNHEVDSISYSMLNSIHLTDSDVESMRSIIVNSLFSFLVTMGIVPVVQCSRNGFSELIARDLSRKIYEALNETQLSLFPSWNSHFPEYSQSSPVLVIYERNNDFCAPLLHSWIYQPLIDDAYELKMNRIVFEPFEDDKRTKSKQVYDFLNIDKFWNDHRLSQFPVIAENIQKEIDEYKLCEERLRKMKTQKNEENITDELLDDFWSESANKLTSAISSLPELMQRKRFIDMHTNVATDLIERIKLRRLDYFCELEDKLISDAVLDLSISSILSDLTIKSIDDKHRLFLIYYLTKQSHSSDFDNAKKYLTDNGVDLSSLNFISQHKTISNVNISPSQSNPSLSSYGSVISKLVAKSPKFVVEGVKNLVSSDKNSSLTRVVSSLLDGKPTNDTVDYVEFDPRVATNKESASQSRLIRSRQFSDAIVYVVGGGCYNEYSQLVNKIKGRKNGNDKNVIYGCTEIYGPSKFLAYLKTLGNERV